MHITYKDGWSYFKRLERKKGTTHFYLISDIYKEKELYHTFIVSMENITNTMSYYAEFIKRKQILLDQLSVTFIEREMKSDKLSKEIEIILGWQEGILPERKKEHLPLTTVLSESDVTETALQQLSNEEPASIAQFFFQMKASQSAELLYSLPETKRLDVLEFILSECVKHENSTELIGSAIEELPFSLQKSILLHIKSNHFSTYEQLKSQGVYYLAFGSLEKLSDSDWTKLNQNISSNILLAKALKISNESLCEKVLVSMPLSRRNLVQKELSKLSYTNEDDFEEAQQVIVKIAKTLIKEGVIKLS